MTEPVTGTPRVLVREYRGRTQSDALGLVTYMLIAHPDGTLAVTYVRHDA